MRRRSHCPAGKRLGIRRDVCGGSPLPGGRKAVKTTKKIIVINTQQKEKKKGGRKERASPAQAASSPWKEPQHLAADLGGGAVPGGGGRGQPLPGRGTAPGGRRAPLCRAAGRPPPPAHRSGGDSDPPLAGRGVTAPPPPRCLRRRVGGGSIRPGRPAAAPFCIYLSFFHSGGGRRGGTSFVAVVGIFDESFGMRRWQRFCINISDNMFRQISSLKLFALFDKGRGAARNATGFMCSLLPT